MADIYVATTGNDSTGDGSSGSPYASLGKAVGDLSAGETIWIKSGTYDITTTTAADVGSASAGGPLELSDSIAARIIGYETTTGDNCPTGDRPKIQANDNCNTLGSVIKITWTANSIMLANLEIDGQSDGVHLIYGNSTSRINVRNCVFRNPGANYGVRVVGCQSCLAYGSTNDSGLYFGCTCQDCYGETSGHSIFRSSRCSRCVAVKGSGTYSYLRGFTSNASVNQCVAYDFDGTNMCGFECWSNTPEYGYGAVAHSCYTGFKLTDACTLNNCYGYNCTSNTGGTGSLLDESITTLSADPFIDAASGNFELNNATSGGLILQASARGIPGMKNNDVGAIPLGVTAAQIAEAMWDYSNRTES